MHAVNRNGRYEVKSSLFHSSCSSRQKVSARRIVVKRQVTVATLMVSSIVMLSSCVADIGTRSASEETTKVDVSGGNSSADGAGGANGDPGDDADGDRGESALAADEKDAEGAGHPGEAGATGTGKSSGVLPPLGEFDPADPNFELFDPCTEIPKEYLQNAGLSEAIEERERQSGFSFCAFESLEGSSGVVIGLTSSRQASIFSATKVSTLSDAEGRSVPVMLIESDMFGEMFCTVGVSTSRGIFKVSHSGDQFEDSYQTKCSKAAETLKNIY